MADRPFDPKDVRVSMVDKGWSESPPGVKIDAPPPPLPKDKPPPPPPLPGSASAASPAKKKSDEITRDETPDISPLDEIEPATEMLPRELPMYEDSGRELLVTRVDDQMQARANAMAELDELHSDKTVVAPALPVAPVAAPVLKGVPLSEPFPVSRSSPTATAAAPPPPPPLPGARSSPNVSSSPKASPKVSSSPSASSSPIVTSVPPFLPQQLLAPVAPVVQPSLVAPVAPVVQPTLVAPALKTELGLQPKVRTAAWPIPQLGEPLQPAPSPAVQSPSPPSAALESTFPAAPSSVTMVDKYGPVSTLRDALLGRVRVANRPVPLWGVLATVLVVTAMLAALFVGVLGGKSASSSGPAPSPSASSESGEPSVASTANPAEKGRPLTLLERAASGDASALATLQQKKPRELGTDEALAIAAGKVAGDVTQVKKVRERLAADPGLAKDKKLVGDLLRFARGRETSDDALATMAALPGPLSADLVYEVWTGTAERSDATELAHSILLGKDVRPKASPALSVALELREATTCEESLALLQRAIDQGDKRALVPINKLARKTGCGPNKRLDCYPCLRDGDLLKKAFNAVRVRREPELLR